MIRKYYAEEKPLPVDVKAVQRLVGARTRDEKAAVENVLDEFFKLAGDGWHHKRCDEEIAAYQDTVPEREARKENDRERKRRSRERRKALFDALREHDIVPPFETRISDLEAMLSRVTSRDTSRDGDSDGTATQTQTQTQTHLPDPDPDITPKGAVVAPEPIPPTRPSPPSAIRTIGDWTPKPETVEFLTSALHGIPHKFVLEQVGEFITYWRDRNLPTASWDSKFIQRCVGEWKRHGATWTANPGENHALDHRSGLSPAGHKLAAIRATVDYDAAKDF